MTDTDYEIFDRSFRRLAGAFRLRLKEAEIVELSRTYFRVLEVAPLDQVMLAGKNCLAKQRTFPKPADWLAAIEGEHTPAFLGDRRQMVMDEAQAYRRAEFLRYEDHPCLCSECCRASVDDRPLRFVPDVLEDDRDERAYDPIGKRVVTPGHWAHGEELLRWYLARDAFAARCRSIPPTLRSVVWAVAREPGQEG